MTSYATRTQSSSEQNDLKKLKSKYASKLSTLKELFADWTDDDLLFVLEEADGVLEVAVDRISEGHANQWGEVKTKKSKKEAQKAKAQAAASVPPAAQPMTYTKPERTQAPKTYIDRNTKSTKGPRISNNNNYNTNNNSRKPGVKQSSSSSWGYSSGQQKSSSTTDTTSGGGSWASIASSNTKPIHEPSSNNDWNASTNITNDTWEQPSWVTDDKESNTVESTNAASSTVNNDIDKPKSWASLLKSQPKPEPEPVKKQETEWNTESNTNDISADAWNATNDDGWNAQKEEPVVDEWSSTTNNNADLSTSAWDATTNNTTTTTTATTSATAITSNNESTNITESIEETITTTITSNEITEDEESKESSRKLKQESPVIMPKNDVAVSDVDVKFGSLNLEEDIVQEKTAAKESVTDTKVETQPQEQSTTAQEQPATVPQTQTTETAIEQPTATATNNVTPAAATTNTSTTAATMSMPQPHPQEPAYAQPQTAQQQQVQPNQQQQQQAQQAQLQQQVQPQLQQVQQQQQQQQQQPQTHQPFGMDHLTSAYSSYLPNQPHSGMSGFGINPMGSLPDYSIYGTDAQRAMGYYDPSAFGNSPVTSAGSYPTRDKFGQDTSASLGNPQGQTPGQSQGLPGQQMYPSMPYYPYYYMPSHYNAAYQQSMYSQHMMNKNLYPNMYQQQTTTASKPTTQSPYGGNGTAAAASPYALHSQLYNQPSTTSAAAAAGSGSGIGSGYDDLQQQFGLHDYQKSPYGNTNNVGGGNATSSQQLHGFLGHHLQGQQSQQTSQQSQQSQGQSVDTKNDATRGTTSQPHHQQQMNYFGQQQMFSYQQYPQQQYWNQ